MKPETIEAIKKWAHEKGIANPDNWMAQFKKFTEESGELMDDLYTGKDISNELGDVLVTLIVLAEIKSVNLEKCLDDVYAKISKRTGKTVNGIFIKD